MIQNRTGSTVVSSCKTDSESSKVAFTLQKVLRYQTQEGSDLELINKYPMTLESYTHINRFPLLSLNTHCYDFTAVISQSDFLHDSRHLLVMCFHCSNREEGQMQGGWGVGCWRELEMLTFSGEQRCIEAAVAAASHPPSPFSLHLSPFVPSSLTLLLCCSPLCRLTGMKSWLLIKTPHPLSLSPHVLSPPYPSLLSLIIAFFFLPHSPYFLLPCSPLLLQLPRSLALGSPLISCELLFFLLIPFSLSLSHLLFPTFPHLNSHV